MGAGWTYKSSKEVFAEIEKNIPSFKGMTYGLLDENQGVVLGKASKPESKKTYYVSHVMVPH
jgi:predicted molibdopterin-dependent oxidoreductase YjgC